MLLIYNNIRPQDKTRRGLLMNQEDYYQDMKVEEDNISLSQLRNAKFIPNSNKIDSQGFLEDYRSLKQLQKDFLLKINMSAKLKQKIFDFPDSKDAQKPDENQKLVALVDPFKGRLIMKEKAWLEIEKQKEGDRIKVEQQLLAKDRQELEQMRKKTQNEKKKKKQKQKQKKPKKQKYLEDNQTEQIQREKQKQKKEKDSPADNFLGSLLKKFSSKSHKQQDENEQNHNHILDNINQQEPSAGQDESEPHNENKRGSSQKLKTNKNESKREAIDNQYNIKIRTPEQPLKLEPSKKSRNDKVLQKQGSREKKSRQLIPQKKQPETVKMESKAQFINKYSDDYEMISEIPRREMREDFSNPSLNEDKESESENMEHMVKSKRKSWKGEH